VPHDSDARISSNNVLVIFSAHGEPDDLMKAVLQPKHLRQAD
jgi:hypothetical protein